MIKESSVESLASEAPDPNSNDISGPDSCSPNQQEAKSSQKGHQSKKSRDIDSNNSQSLPKCEPVYSCDSKKNTSRNNVSPTSSGSLYTKYANRRTRATREKGQGNGVKSVKNNNVEPSVQPKEKTNIAFNKKKDQFHRKLNKIETGNSNRNVFVSAEENVKTRKEYKKKNTKPVSKKQFLEPDNMFFSNPKLKQTQPDLNNARKENNQGDFFAQQQEYARSEASYSRAIKILSDGNSDRILLFLKRGIVLEAQGEYLKSLKDYGSSIKQAYTSLRKKHPVSPLINEFNGTFEALLILALFLEVFLLKKLGRFGEAILVYEEILREFPQSASFVPYEVTQCKQSLKDNGDYLYRQRKYKEAEKAYTDLIKFIPHKEVGDLVLILSNRSASFIELREYKECLKDCNMAINLINGIRGNPTSPLLEGTGSTIGGILTKLLLRRAYAFASLKEYSTAILTFRIVLRRNSQVQLAKAGLQNCKTFLFMKQGVSAYMSKNFNKAAKLYTNAIDSLPEEHRDRIVLLHSRAKVFYEQQSFIACSKDCRLIRNLLDSEFLNNSATSPLMKEMKITFVDLLLSVTRIESRIYESQGNYSQVADIYEKARSHINLMDQHPAKLTISPMLYQEEGNIYREVNNHDKAQELYTKAINLLPKHHGDLILLLNNRADSFLKQGKYFINCLQDCKRAILLAYEKIKESKPITPLMETAMTTVKEQLIRALKCKALAHERTKDYEKAIIAYEEIMDNSGDVHTADEIKKCEILAKAKKAEEARERKRLEEIQKARERERLEKLKETERLKKEESERLKKEKARENERLRKEEEARERERLRRLEEARERERLRKLEEIRERERKRKEEALERERLAKAENEEKQSKEPYVNAKIDEWSMIRGKICDFRTLLGTLDLVLWPQVQPNCGKITSLSKANECKKFYQMLITRIHPDKLPRNSTVEQKMLATGVFMKLKESWETFKLQNDL